MTAAMLIEFIILILKALGFFGWFGFLSRSKLELIVKSVQYAIERHAVETGLRNITKEGQQVSVGLALFGGDGETMRAVDSAYFKVFSRYNLES